MEIKQSALTAKFNANENGVIIKKNSHRSGSIGLTPSAIALL